MCDTSLGPSVDASHDARLDVLVGDLLVVVVGAAAGRVHRRRRHGVEGEDELLSVAHAGGLGMVAGYTCGRGVWISVTNVALQRQRPCTHVVTSRLGLVAHECGQRKTINRQNN